MKKVIKTLMKILVAGGLSLLLISSVWGDVTPTSEWVNLYGDSVLMRNSGEITSYPIPIGTIVDAFTKNGLHCGTTIVDSNMGVGKYGFLPVYKDDFTTPKVDGATEGSPIYFRINSRVATVVENQKMFWSVSGDRIKANLHSPTLIKLAEASFVKGKGIKPGDTVEFTINIKNTGEGTDFYRLSCKSSNGWSIAADSAYFVDAGETIIFTVTLTVPMSADPKDDETITYTITSEADTSQKIIGTLKAYFETTDTPEDNGALPEGFKLNQNYPNPFNPSTRISYTLSASSVVSLEIFDLLGRSVQRFDLGRQEAGSHTFEYMAERMPSGIYFYKINAGEFSDIKKMILMK